MIHCIRGEKVLLDADLVSLYGVEVKRLKEAVRRNIRRFPADFLFVVSADEMKSLRSQFASLKQGQHSKYPPFAFTEQGVAMLSSVLHSARTIKVNIAIMRAFVQMRRFLETHKELARLPLIPGRLLYQRIPEKEEEQKGGSGDLHAPGSVVPGPEKVEGKDGQGEEGERRQGRPAEEE